jgi:hypothetical protein
LRSYDKSCNQYNNEKCSNKPRDILKRDFKLKSSILDDFEFAVNAEFVKLCGEKLINASVTFKSNKGISIKFEKSMKSKVFKLPHRYQNC